MGVKDIPQQLNAQQEATLQQYLQKWHLITSDTVTNHSETERMLKIIYKEIGAKEPTRIIWTKSPIELYLISGYCHYYEDVLDKKDFNFNVDEVLSNKVSTEIAKKYARDEDLKGLQSLRELAKKFAVPNEFRHVGYGCHDGSWLAFHDFFRNEFGCKKETDKLLSLMELAKYSGWYLMYDTVCIVCEKPKVFDMDEERRLHSHDRPALQWNDGSKLSFSHLLNIPNKIIEDPKSITVDSIFKESNEEIRRIMIELYEKNDEGRFIRDANPIVLDKATIKGKKYRLLKVELANDEPYVALEMEDFSKGPDGIFHKYYPRIHPECRPMIGINSEGKSLYGEPQKMTCQNALASMVGLTGDQYNPEVET